MKILASERNRICIGKGKMTVGYLLAGYPDKKRFLDVLTGCEQAGMDIFEIGYPSGDPSGDGEVIKKAHEATDLSLQNDLDYWKNIRAAVQAPIWVMAYGRDLISTGFYKKLAENRLADALVIPDISLDQRLQLQEELHSSEIDVLGFVGPDTPMDEKEACFRIFPLIYQQLYSGPTGMPVETDEYREILEHAKQFDATYVFAGFGINSAERADQLLDSGFDGIIVGTAMISKLNQSAEELTEFVNQLHLTASRRR